VLTALRKHPYLLGDRFSGADLLFASMAQWSRGSLPKGELVDAWLARVNARPALARATARDAG
jgi:glutathione S-transferase